MKEKRIAVLPLVKKKRKRKVCLVTGRITGKWIPPTGKYEPHISHKRVAALEAFEEAGLIGKLDKKFCKKITYKKSGSGHKRTLKIYRMRVTKVFKDWPEKKQRKRELFAINKIKQAVSDKKLAKKLAKLI